MRKLSIMLLFCLGIIEYLQAQQIEKYKSFIPLLVNEINQKSVDKVLPFLSEDFSILGHQGEIGKEVFKMLVTQSLNDSILSFQELPSLIDSEQTILVYEFIYQKRGVEKTVISFNTDNEITSITLFQATVKVLSKEDKFNVINKATLGFQNIPFRLINNLIIIDVIVNNQKKNFILDTGSPRTVLNSVYQDTKIPSISNLKGINSTLSDQDIIRIESIELGKLKVVNEKVLVNNFSHLEKELECELYGIIGTDFIEEFDLLFDYTNRIITLISPNILNEYVDTVLKKSEFFEVPVLTFKGHLPIVNTYIQDQKLNMALDCGANSCVLSSTFFDRLSSVLKRPQYEEVLGASNKINRVKKAKIKKLQLGMKTYKSVNTVFMNLDHLNNSKNIHIDGIIGYDIFSSQKIILSYSRKKIYIEYDDSNL